MILMSGGSVPAPLALCMVLRGLVVLDVLIPVQTNARKNLTLDFWYACTTDFSVNMRNGYAAGYVVI